MAWGNSGFWPGRRAAPGRAFAGGLAVVFGAILCWQRPAAGQPAAPKVSMHASVGLGGVARPGRPAPVVVEFDNPGDPLRGECVVRGPGGRETRLAVDLPRYSRKRYTALVLTPQPGGAAQPFRVTVSLISGGEVVLRETVQPSRPPPAGLVVASCTDSDASLPRGLPLYAQSPGAPAAVESLHLAPVEVPRQWPALAAADVLVINGNGWLALDADQRAAVRTWVEQDGRPGSPSARLILCGDRAGPWRDAAAGLLPGIRSARALLVVDLVALSNWPGGRVYTPSAGTRVPVVTGVAAAADVPLLFQDGVALACRRHAGSGVVLWIGFDPFQPAFREWEGAPPFWREALRIVMMARSRDDPGSSPALGAVFDSAPAAPLFAVARRAILIAAGAAFLVLGPLSAVLLRRYRRAGGSWLLVPCLSAGLALALLLAPGSLASRAARVESVTVLTAWPGARSMRQTTAVGLHSVFRGPAALDVDDPFPSLSGLRGPADPAGSPQVPLPEWPDVQGPGEAVFGRLATDGPVPAWVVSWARTMEQPVEVARRAGGLELVNGTPYTLGPCWIEAGGRRRAVGSAGPGGRLDLRREGQSGLRGAMGSDLPSLPRWLAEASGGGPGRGAAGPRRWFVARVSGFETGVRMWGKLCSGDRCVMRLPLPEEAE